MRSLLLLMCQVCLREVVQAACDAWHVGDMWYPLHQIFQLFIFWAMVGLCLLVPGTMKRLVLANKL